MFQLTVESVFSAAHALMFRGALEPLHSHDWHVTVCIEGPELDGDGVLWDFHEIETMVSAVTAPFKNRSLNEAEPFAHRTDSGNWELRLNPSAEAVARHIGEQVGASLRAQVQSRLARYPKMEEGPTGWPSGVRLVSVRVTEAVGCAATWLANR